MRTAIALFCAVAVTAAGTDTNTQIDKLIAADTAFGDQFSRSLSMTLSYALIGAPTNDGDGDSAGAAYVFDYVTGQELMRVTPADIQPNDFFGWDVAGTGQRLFVSALNSGFGSNETGSVYVFNLFTGQQLGELVGSDIAEGDGFGLSIAASGSRLLIGAPTDNTPAEEAGSAYVFNAGTNQQLFKLTASDGTASDRFGTDVAVSGSLAVVGAPFADPLGSSSGAAYVFSATSGQQLQKLVPNDGAPQDWFGFAVAISGSLAVVGSPRDDDAGSISGSAYVFDAATGEQLHKLTASDASEGDGFGDSVAISGNLVVVGSGSSASPGSAYVFDAETGQELYKLIASDGENGDALGYQVAVIGNRTVCSALNHNGTGTAYVFDVTPCFADLNNDNTVDLTDLNIILGNFGNTTTNGDTNSDGVVDLADLNRVLNEFGTDCP
ncbi:MAG: hypothetical protein ACFHWZ_02795 [Phycisphaerales bacterium]